jgi:hypothetical protein
MKVELVFHDWRKEGEADSIYNTELGVVLSVGDLHSGTVFHADLTLTPEIEREITRAWEEHKAYPVFWVVPE